MVVSFEELEFSVDGAWAGGRREMVVMAGQAGEQRRWVRMKEPTRPVEPITVMLCIAGCLLGFLGGRRLWGSCWWIRGVNRCSDWTSTLIPRP